MDQENDKAFRDLLIEIASGDIGGDRFNNLLIETGIFLDDKEWEFANRLLGKSDEMKSLAVDSLCMQ